MHPRFQTLFQFTAVVSWGLTGQGRRLGFTALRGSLKRFIKEVHLRGFINGPFSLGLLCNQKFQLTFLNTTNNWCTKLFTAVVSWGLTGQGRRLGFTAFRVSHKKERTPHARNIMFFCHSIQWGNDCHFNWRLQISTKNWQEIIWNWLL
jgi:hypothetical protein